MRLSALSVAATGQVGFCCFPQVDALLIDAVQTLRDVQVRICKNRESESVTRCCLIQFCEPAVISCRLTDGQTVVADSDGGGPHWQAAGQAAQHWLNRVTLGLLAMQDHLLLQLHRLKLHVTL